MFQRDRQPSSDPEVLVVGAGPAGSIAALILARAGARVRVIDRAHFPRPKLCGDTLNPGALAMLDHLRVSAGIRARGLPVSGMVVTGPGGARVVGEYDAGVAGIAITRQDLDMLLLDAAIRAGAEFDPGVVVRAPLMAPDGLRVMGVRVAASAQEHDLRARIVIGADGRHSRLAFNLGLACYARHPRRWAFGAYYADVQETTSHGEMHIRPDGYVGVAPVPDGLTNVCVVRELGTSFRAQRVESDTVIERAVSGDPELQERFARAQRVTPITVLGPLAVESMHAGQPGLLLAGDAAGFIDPMTGDGLRFAIRGAELAAAAALRELETGHSMHRELAARRRHEFGGKWRFNRALRALVASPRALGLAATLASQWHAPVRTLIALAGDVNIAKRSELNVASHTSRK
jgi:menaquinone-9 beta-reductase